MRPSDYTPELADHICEHIAAGKSLTSYCSGSEAPGYTTVMRWLREHEDFRQKYAHAREQQADYLAEEIQDIADEVGKDAAAQRLRIDTRKWRASKMLPKKYGERQTLAHEGGDTPIAHIHKIERIIVDPAKPEGSSL